MTDIPTTTIDDFRRFSLGALCERSGTDCIFSENSDLLRDKIKDAISQQNPNIHIEGLFWDRHTTIHEVHNFFRNPPSLKENQRGIIIISHIYRLEQDVADHIIAWVKDADMSESNPRRTILLFDNSFRESQQAISKISFVRLHSCRKYEIEIEPNLL